MVIFEHECLLACKAQVLPALKDFFISYFRLKVVWNEYSLNVTEQKLQVLEVK